MIYGQKRPSYIGIFILKKLSKFNQFKIKLPEKLNMFGTILHTSNLFGPDIAANIDKIYDYNDL